MLAAYIQGRGLLFPQTVGAANRKEGYLRGVKRSIRLYLLVVLALAAAAVYEALVAVFIMSRLE